jgi:hypothetical protein
MGKKFCLRHLYEGENDCPQCELAALRAALAEIKESFALTVSGECAPDEKHCTCVPALRGEINTLRATVEERDKRILELILDRDHWKRTSDRRYAMRREFEELLGVSNGMTYTEDGFRTALDRMKELQDAESRLTISNDRLTEVCREAGVQRTRAEEAERRVCRVREAMKEYGVHKDHCGYVYSGDPNEAAERVQECTCGFNAALATGPCVHEAELEALEWSLDDCLAHYPADIFPEPTEEDFAHVHARKGCSEVLHGSWARHLVKVIRDNAARKLAEGGGK